MLKTLKTLNLNLILFVVIGAILVYIFASSICQYQHHRATTENFVASNNEEYVEGRPASLARDDELLRRLFQEIVNGDANKLKDKIFEEKDFRKTTYFEEEIKGIIHYVLKKINISGDRRFTALDFQSADKRVTVDKKTGDILNKFVINLFIQEKNKLNVHAHGMNISFQVLQHNQNVKIEKLHTITDHFYRKTDGIEASNRYDDYVRLDNRFHLAKPWKTNEPKVIMDDKKTEELLSQWNRDLKTPQYKCFTDSGSIITPEETGDFYTDQGSRYMTQKGCKDSQGVWDQPIKNDGECPFYRKNLNYPNRLGGKQLHTDQCDMPIGTKTVGYRFVSNDPAHKPWCYNCKIGADGMSNSIGPCCDAQMDRELYPNLVSPDFAFDGDEFLRMQFSRELAERGLEWSKHPTKIRSIENQNQKQPVFNAIIGNGVGKTTLP